MSDFDQKIETPEPQSEGMASVVIDGTTYRVPQGMADGINSERATQPTPANPEPQVQATPGIPEADSEEFWADPQKYINERIKAGVQDGIKSVEVKQNAQNAEQKFWKGFYAKNPHLKQIDSYMEFIAGKNAGNLAQFKGDHTKIANYIADLGNKELQKFGKTPETSAVFVEGSAQPTTVVPTPPQKTRSDNVTMGDVLKKRRETRRKARLGV